MVLPIPLLLPVIRALFPSSEPRSAVGVSAQPTQLHVFYLPLVQKVGRFYLALIKMPEIIQFDDFERLGRWISCQ